jgi:hypothetical protein
VNAQTYPDRPIRMMMDFRQVARPTLSAASWRPRYQNV